VATSIEPDPLAGRRDGRALDRGLKKRHVAVTNAPEADCK
jgi:hypothetical protein